MRGNTSSLAPTPPALLIARVPPDRTQWLAWLSPQIADTLLQEVAAADYGYQFAANLTALRRIRDQQRLPEVLNDFPQEVLELIRWSEPDDLASAPGHYGPDGHRLRLFCCAILLAVAGDAQFAPYLDDRPTLRQCVASAVWLGDDAIDVILPLLCWRSVAATALPEDCAFLAFGIVLLAAARYRAPSDAPLLSALCDWASAAESWARSVVTAPSLVTANWLLGLEFSAEGHDHWRDLTWRILIEPPQPHPAAAATALYQLGARLLCGDG